jgi:hypothetical protein
MERFEKLKAEIPLKFGPQFVYAQVFPDTAFQKAYREAKYQAEREEDLNTALGRLALERPLEFVTHFPGKRLPEWHPSSSFERYKNEFANLSVAYENLAKHVAGEGTLTEAEAFLVERLFQEKSLGFLLFAGRYSDDATQLRAVRTLLEMPSIEGRSPLVWIAQKIEASYGRAHMNWLADKIPEVLKSDPKLNDRLLREWVIAEPSEEIQETLRHVLPSNEIAGLVKEKIHGVPSEQWTEAQKKWVRQYEGASYSCSGRYAALLKKARQR